MQLNNWIICKYNNNIINNNNNNNNNNSIQFININMGGTKL